MTFTTTLGTGVPIPGPPGPTGPPGANGAPGPGLAAGGSTNQILAKRSGADYDTNWVAPPTGGSGGSGFDINTAVQTASYTAAANEFVLFDTTTPATRNVTLPPAPANGTQVGARIVTYGTGNNVGFIASGTDTFNKSGGPTTQTGQLTAINQTQIYQYDTGIWTVVSAYTPNASLDARIAAALAAQPALGPGTDIQLDAIVGGTQPVSVLQTSHDLWTPLWIRATVDDPAPANNTATAHDDPVLALTTVAGTYDVDAFILYDATNTAKFRATWSHSGTATMAEWWAYVLPSSYAGTGNITFPGSNFQPQTSLTAQQQWGGGGTVPGTTSVARVWGTLIVTVAGTLHFRYAQGTATVENTIRKAGSKITLRKVA